MEEDNTLTQVAESVAATSRRKWRFDAASRITTMVEPGGASTTFPLYSLTQPSLDYIAQLGLVLFLGRADDPNAAYYRLAAGNYPKPGEKQERMNPWRQAIAAAMQEASKRAGAPLTPEAAKDRALALSKEDVAEFKTDPAVIKHWHKINGTTPKGVASLLAA